MIGDVDGEEFAAKTQEGRCTGEALAPDFLSLPPDLRVSVPKRVDEWCGSSSSLVSVHALWALASAIWDSGTTRFKSSCGR